MTRSLALAALVLSAAASAHAQAPQVPPPAGLDPKKPVYVTAHVDVIGTYLDKTLDALKTYVEAARREPGAVRVEAVEEARSNHFDLIEVWRDRAAYDAHAGSAATVRFHDTIHPWRGSPFEERLANLVAP
ncbi:MAG TPA: antibiotic biosynthesis monooxygenase family protein [Caulobacteraceae bacterium]|jgi:quinol monooxygenase YgiN|nr:antibiotic biosynthesis monooxygenase family protein [Caulobacteraceae bacterium]